jgi:hypothetical protein
VNLKAYGRARWKDDAEADAAAESMIHDESDRGAILMSATNVEDMLEYKILQRLPTLLEDETARKSMFDQDGPLSTFSRKIVMAYAMGIIDKPYRKLIDLVRDIRNTAAHSRLPISVQVPPIKVAIEMLVADSIEGLQTDNPRALLGAYAIKCATLAHYIVNGEKIEGMEALRNFHEGIQDKPEE